MIKRLVTNRTKTITGAALILGAASFISRLIGLLRDRTFAHVFGAGDVLDVYYAAFRVPDLIYNLVVVGALSAGFIPVFVKVINKKSLEDGWKLTNNIITILSFSLIVICSLLFIFTPHLIKFLVPGFGMEKALYTAKLTRIMLLSPIILGISGIVSSVLQSLKSFLVYALTPIVYNLGIIFGAIFLVPAWGITGLAWGVIIGATLHLLIQIPTLLHYGFKPRLSFSWGDNAVCEIGKLMIPRTLSLVAAQLNIVAITIIASTLVSGSLAVFNFANNLQFFPIGIFGISFAIAAFPTLSKLASKDNNEEFIGNLSRTIRQIIFFIVPMTVLFLLLRAQIVRVLFGTGQFSWDDTILTADTLAFFSLSMLAQCLIPLLARAFFAISDTWTPFVAAFISTLINIILALILKDVLGVAGLALAFSISMIINLVILWIALRRRLGTLQELLILPTLYITSIASLFMGVTTQTIKYFLGLSFDLDRFWGILLQGLISGTIGILVYILICQAFRLPEISSLKQSLQRHYLKLTNVKSEINEADEV